jgi:hypothetical protein
MTKAFTEAEFSAQLDGDRSWRIKEISDLKSAAIKADTGLRRVLLRSAITICYAHWEGHVRFAARKYFEYLALRKFQYKALDRQFLRNYFLPQLAALSKSKPSIEQRCDLVDEILNSSERRFSRMNEDLVNTKANLNFEVLSDICIVCNVPTTYFEDKATFIDLFLLRRRNSVAHGEELFLEIGDLDELTTETVSLMRTFGNAIENHIYLRTYRSA